MSLQVFCRNHKLNVMMNRRSLLCYADAMIFLTLNVLILYLLYPPNRSEQNATMLLSLVVCCRLKTTDFPVHLLPPILPAGTEAGRTTGSLCGLSADVSVCVALGDAQCSVSSTQLSSHQAGNCNSSISGQHFVRGIFKTEILWRILQLLELHFRVVFLELVKGDLSRFVDRLFTDCGRGLRYDYSFEGFMEK